MITPTLVGLRFTIKRLINALISEESRAKSPRVQTSTDDEKCVFIFVKRGRTPLTYDVLLDIYFHKDFMFQQSSAFVDAFCTSSGMVKVEHSTVRLGCVDEDVRIHYDRCRDATSYMYSRLGHILSAQLCACKKAIIPDDEGLCYTCGLTLTEPDMGQTFCPICHDLKVAKVVRTSCCKVNLHETCLSRVFEYRMRCPFCRSEDVRGIQAVSSSATTDEPCGSIDR